MPDPEELTTHLERHLASLADGFHENGCDFFFTEKELHAYLYHLCMADGGFRHGGHCLLHAEYPTPFKCSVLKTMPFLEAAPEASKCQRGHIDLVLMNPRFLDWCVEHGHDPLLPMGLGYTRFDLYVKPLYATYAAFCQSTGLPILLYALEFKYLRHSYVGTKYPKQTIHQDFAKLRLLRESGRGRDFSFVAHTKVVIYLGERMGRHADAIRRELTPYDAGEYDLVTWKP